MDERSNEASNVRIVVETKVTLSGSNSEEMC